MRKNIFAIGRQFGSGGREIGRRLAEMLDIPFWDRELITEASKKSGIKEEYFQKIDETAASSLLYSLSAGAYMMGNQMSAVGELPLNDRLYMVQAELIREKASAGPCVIVGRCADYILQEDPRCLSIFIHAEEAVRLRRITEVYGIDSKKAPDIMRRTNKKRAHYYNYYTNNNWGDVTNYHLSFDSAKTGVDGGADLIRAFAEYCV